MFVTIFCQKKSASLKLADSLQLNFDKIKMPFLLSFE